MFTCISCRVAFDSADEQRSHFSTDWHRYNMKRRVASLPPVAAAAFNEKVIERREQNAVRTDPRDLVCGPCNKTFASENAYRSHIQSKKHRECEAHLLAKRHVSQREESEAHPVEESSNASAEEVGSEDDRDIEEKLASSRRRRYLPSDCLFCQRRFSTIELALEHMYRTHSFFLPDQDHLHDLPGLLSYLGEKVVIGNICLYCPNGGKEFGSLESVRRHMVDKGHCRLAFETDEDRAELADYFSFNIVDNDEDWEDVDADGDVDLSDSASALNNRPALAGDGLSLILPSGRILGHRSLRIYYEQKFRPFPHHQSKEQTVAAKVAQIKERLADPSQALVPVAGGSGGYGKGLQVVRARNSGEARWAQRQGRSFMDQKRRLQHQTLVGFKHNNQKHFRDPLLQ